MRGRSKPREWRGHETAQPRVPEEKEVEAESDPASAIEERMERGVGAGVPSPQFKLPIVDSYLSYWQLDLDEIDELLAENPSLRSFMSGYAAELKCRKIYFDNDPRVSNVHKPDDHDRTSKGDIVLDYRGETFAVEVKSLQLNNIKSPKSPPRRPKPTWRSPYPSGTTLTANFQCDASDRRTVEFSDGSALETTCLAVGEFDIVAVNVHGFTGEWNFWFAKNDDLPRVAGKRGASRNYTQLQRDGLLATSVPIHHPNPGSIFSSDPFGLLDELIERRRVGAEPQGPEVVD